MPSASEVADEVMKRLTQGQTPNWPGPRLDHEIDIIRRHVRENTRMSVATFRAVLGLPDSPDDDEKWAMRVEGGTHTMRDAFTALRERAG